MPTSFIDLHFQFLHYDLRHECKLLVKRVSGFCWIQQILNTYYMESSRPSTENKHSMAPGLKKTSLVVQWLIIRLPMQGTQVQSLVREAPTCRGATKPVHHNYWACALEPAHHNYWALVPQLLKPAPRARAPQQEKPPQWEAHTLQRRVAPATLRGEPKTDY